MDDKAVAKELFKNTMLNPECIEDIDALKNAVEGTEYNYFSAVFNRIAEEGFDIKHYGIFTAISSIYEYFKVSPKKGHLLDLFKDAYRAGIYADLKVHVYQKDNHDFVVVPYTIDLEERHSLKEAEREWLQ